MTTVCTEFEKGVKGDNYGPRLECPSVHTGVMAASMPWKGPETFKGDIQSGRSLTSVIVLQRDVGAGKVVGCGKGGMEPSISYSIHQDDAKNITNGLCKAFDILAVNPKVDKIWTCHPGQEPYENAKADGKIDEEKADEFRRQVKRDGIGVNQTGMFCAHQMGSCRMAGDSELGAVDVDGELWEMEGVFVMDASIFPTATGANPMMTTMALCRGLAKRLVEVHNGTARGKEILQLRAERRAAERKRRKRVREQKENVTIIFILSFIALAFLLIASQSFVNNNFTPS